MSGGFAYVLDEAGDFEKRCNLGMVELEALSPEDAAFVAELARGAPRAHRQPEGERAAGQLGERPDSQFVKVVPIEYRRVLAEMQRQRAKRLRQAAACLCYSRTPKPARRSADARMSRALRPLRATQTSRVSSRGKNHRIS